MKKLFSFLMIVFTTLSFVASAQPPTSLKIVNNSHCTVCFYVAGAKGPDCIPLTSRTNIICLLPGGSITWSNTSVAPFSPPMAAGGIFSMLCWYNYDPSSICPAIPLSQRCIYDKCAGTPQVDKQNVYNSDCKLCGSVTGTWSSSGGMATVVFN